MFSWRRREGDIQSYWYNHAAKTCFYLWKLKKWQSSASPWPLGCWVWTLSCGPISYKLIEKKIFFVLWTTLSTDLCHYFFLQLLFWFSSSSTPPRHSPRQAEYEFQLNQNLCWFNAPFLLWYTYYQGIRMQLRLMSTKTVFWLFVTLIVVFVPTSKSSRLLEQEWGMIRICVLHKQDTTPEWH